MLGSQAEDLVQAQSLCGQTLEIKTFDPFFLA